MPNEENNAAKAGKAASGKSGKKTSGAHAKAAQSAYIQRSSRMRKILITVIVVLVLIIAAICVLVFQMVQTAQDAAVQQTQISDVDTPSIEGDGAEKDVTTNVTKKTTVPNLVELLGKTMDEAIELLGHGAEVISNMEVNEEGNPIRYEVRIALTEEPSDSRTGTPTVYLSINEVGATLTAGYSVSTSSLGYGSISFTDAVTKEYIVEKTLGEAGLTVNYGTVQLPSDKSEYVFYGTDGTTTAKEYCSFAGTGQADGVEHPWEAILSYDYSVANATDNLNDTIRTIYIYISQDAMPEESQETPQEEPQQ